MNLNCEKCGSDELATTLRGVVTGPDPNTYKCQNCGNWGNVADIQSWACRSFVPYTQYNRAKPFPHAVIDGLFNADLIAQAEQEFPPWESPVWSKFDNSRELKGITADLNVMRPATQALIVELLSPDFSAKLSKMTGISDLLPDLYGGGMHVVPPGGKLGIHADYNRGPRGYRRLNVLLFLNSNWKARYGGDLELWREDRSFFQSIAPNANRLVVFNTSDVSFHGHPEPLPCPSDRARKSLAVYFFTAEPPKGASDAHSTIFMEGE